MMFAAPHAWGQKQLRVAAAADLQPVMPVWSQAYEHATGVKLVVSFGSSSTLATQIIDGAPMDIFLGADFVYPEKIVAAGLADTTAPTAYAKGTLVLWTRKDSSLLPLSMDRLTDPRVKTVAIANELHAPYGRAAAEALRKMKLYDQVSPHFVVGENISQTAQFVESGNAQLGLISLTAAESQHFKEIGTYVLVPTSQYPQIRQYAVVMKNSDRRADAHAFLDWLLSSPVQDNLSKLGLRPVK
ncbi:MAG TPA: molybdate ABC transporter substrate-binding protein [Edaphobacter sp.]|nr:molybdate ABC transporter substrate-binding protein [Edaphobacter sp.]